MTSATSVLTFAASVPVRCVSGCGGVNWPTLIVAIVSVALSFGVIVLAIETLGAARRTADDANAQLAIVREEHKVLMAQLTARSDLRITIDDTFDSAAVGYSNYPWRVTLTIDNANGTKAAHNVDVRILAPADAGPNPTSPGFAADLVDDPELGNRTSEYYIRLPVVTRSSPSKLMLNLNVPYRGDDTRETVIGCRVQVSCDDQPDDVTDGRYWTLRWPTDPAPG